MIIRQEEETPIGNFFHDNGMLKTFKRIEEMVDDFEVDTDRLKMWCDEMVNHMKSLKNFVTAQEKNTLKKEVQREVEDFRDK